MMSAGEAPSYVCWGHNTRSAMIRVPMYKPLKGQSTRIELRTIDAACNPYLAFAVILAAGLKGVEDDYELPRDGGRTDRSELLGRGFQAAEGARAGLGRLGEGARPREWILGHTADP